MKEFSAAVLLACLAASPVRATRAVPLPDSQRPNSDLYYFTPEEAALAREQARIWGEPQGGGDAGFVFDTDVPAAIQRQVLDDLALLRGVRGRRASGLHTEIFGSVDGGNYGRFFVDRVSGIGMDDCGSSIAIACVIPYQDSSKMWLTPNYSRYDHPPIARLMVLYHEARHTEGRNGYWGHARCPADFPFRSIWTNAPLANQPACDRTPYGSYGSATILLKNIQLFCEEGCDDKMQRDAGLFADDQLNRIIDPASRQAMERDFSR